MGGPDMAPQTPPRSDAPRPGRGAPRSHGADSGGLEMAPQPHQRSDARWRSRGAPCSGDAGLGGPDMVRRTPRRSDAASLGGAEMMGPRLPGGLARPGGAGALFDILGAPTELLEDGLELELAADRPVGFYDLEAGHRVVVNVAVLVEVPLAVDTLEVLDGGDRLAHRLTLLGDAAHVDEVGARRADLGEHRLLVRLLPVDALIGDDRQSELLGHRLEDVGDAFAVELLVVEDKDLLGAQALGPLGADGALNVVGRHRAEVVHEPAGPIDLRLAGRRAALPCEPSIRVGRRDLRHVGAVVDRDRDLGRSGVVGADVDDRERIAHRLVRVLGLHRTVPLARLGPGVVQVDDLEAVARDNAADLGYREVHAVLHARAFGDHRPLHRPRRVETQLTLGTLLGVGATEPDDEAQQRDG